MLITLSLIGAIALIAFLAVDASTDAAKVGFGAVFGLVSIAFTQFLSTHLALEKTTKDRLQITGREARRLVIIP